MKKTGTHNLLNLPRSILTPAILLALSSAPTLTTNQIITAESDHQIPVITGPQSMVHSGDVELRTSNQLFTTYYGYDAKKVAKYV